MNNPRNQKKKNIPLPQKKPVNTACILKIIGYGVAILGITFILCLRESEIRFIKDIPQSHAIVQDERNLAISNLTSNTLYSKLVDNDISEVKENNVTINKVTVIEKIKKISDVKVIKPTINKEIITQQIKSDKEMGSVNQDIIDSISNQITVVHLTHGTSTSSNKRAYHEAYKETQKNTLNPIPRKVWAFWFGKPMRGDRLNAFKELKKNIGVAVELVTDKTLPQYSVKEWPIHPAIFSGSLSGIHKGDYLRAYFMYHYGGGYHDIKPHEKKNKWTTFFSAFDSDPSLWLYGIIEKGPDGMSCDESYMLDMAITDEDFDSDKVLSHMEVQLDTDFATKTGFSCGKLYEQERDKMLSAHKGKLTVEEKNPKEQLCCSEVFKNYNSYTFVTNIAYIMRDHTDFGYDWLRLTEAHLDVKFETIKSNPAPTQRCCNPSRPPYPLRWAELHGEAFHPLQMKYNSHLKTGLPKWKKGTYRSISEGQ